MRKLALIIILLLVLPFTFAVAQDNVLPGEGQPIIEGNATGSINIGSLNPLRCLAVVRW